VVKLIKWTKDLDRRVSKLTDEISEIKEEATPMFHSLKRFVDNVNEITDKVEYTIEGANKILENANSIVEKGVEIADDVVNFERKIKGSIEPQVMDTINTYAALVKGVKVFFDKIKNRNNGHSNNALDLDFRAKIYNEDIQEEYDEIDKELNEVRKKLDEMKKH
jgi:uncharacterized protein YoxC